MEVVKKTSQRKKEVNFFASSSALPSLGCNKRSPCSHPSGRKKDSFVIGEARAKPESEDHLHNVGGIKR